MYPETAGDGHVRNTLYVLQTLHYKQPQIDKLDECTGAGTPRLRKLL